MVNGQCILSTLAAVDKKEGAVRLVPSFTLSSSHSSIVTSSTYFPSMTWWYTLTGIELWQGTVWLNMVAR